MARWIGRNVLSIDDIDQEDIVELFKRADGLQGAWPHVFETLKFARVTNLFYEPSTRTAKSFEAAAQMLGADVLNITEPAYSSISKGESLEDTVRTLACYSNLIVLRHPDVGAAARAAKVAGVPVVNAGDGVGEHPTQALLDLYCIYRELGTLDGLTVGLVGDLKHGRTVHSLAKLLSRYDTKFVLVSPPAMGMPEGYCEGECMTLEEAVPQVDVLYVTRVQKERLSAEDLTAHGLSGGYVITPETMSRAKASMALMHPFPRVGEILPSVDSDPRAAYFRQIEGGLWVRAALLSLVLGSVNQEGYLPLAKNR